MSSKEYANFILDLLSPFGNIKARAMFGGYGIYKDGVIIGIIADDELYFKVEKGNEKEYEQYNSEPFTYSAKSKQVKLPYWKVPVEVLDNPELMGEWLEQAYQVSIKARK